jgi:hypothetical protein
MEQRARVGNPPTVRLSLELVYRLGTPAGVTLARLLTDITVLYDLSHRAWQTQVPLVYLLAEASRTYDARERLQQGKRFHHDQPSYVWTAERLRSYGDVVPPLPTDAQGPFDHHRYPLRFRRVTFASPLTILSEIPWEHFAMGGGIWVFVKAVEHLFNTPHRISTESARLRAEEAGYRADERENELREAAALDMLMTLREETGFRLTSGDLEVSEELPEGEEELHGW